MVKCIGRYSRCNMYIQYPVALVLFNSNFFLLLLCQVPSEKETSCKLNERHWFTKNYMKTDSTIFTPIAFHVVQARQFRLSAIFHPRHHTYYILHENSSGRWVENNEKVRKQTNSNNKHTPPHPPQGQTQNHADIQKWKLIISENPFTLSAIPTFKFINLLLWMNFKIKIKQHTRWFESNSKHTYIFSDMKQNNFSSVISHFIVLLFWNVNQFSPEIDKSGVGGGCARASERGCRSRPKYKN